LFWNRVDLDGPPANLRPDLGPCWLWTGAVDAGGYGRVRWKGTNTHAHLVTKDMATGPGRPRGLRFEPFACGIRRCVNPDHWRPKVGQDSVAGARGLARWNFGRARCIEGHPFTSANILLVPGGWACRTCRKGVERSRRSR
jgi:hypothetical protein